MIICKSNKL